MAAFDSLKTLHLWFPGYLAQKRTRECATPTHVFFCFVDHFEPLWRGASLETAIERVRLWRERYPTLVEPFRRSDGRGPRRTFFYPAEGYRPELLDELARICSAGYGEVEVHLHHDNDTAENLARTLEDFKVKLRSHGLLPSDSEGRVRYGFIHGNWSLDNSRRDGRWCGVNNELQVLRDTGCYADFTLPSAPSDTQTRKINSIYYATDDPHRPKSHDSGVDVCVGGKAHGDLLIVQGPLAPNWRRRRWGIVPTIENGDVAGHKPATPARVDSWVRQRIGVEGRPDWIFVKVHTHGCVDANYDAVLGERARRMYEYLERKYNDGRNFVLHHVTTREFFNLIKAAEAGVKGDPHKYRNFILSPPPICQ